MSGTTRLLSRTLAVALVVPPPLFASDHLVTEHEIVARLKAAAEERTSNRLKVERLPSGHIAAEAAFARGQDGGRLGGSVALSDEELRDLAARADALETDPVAGGTKKTLIIVGVVVLVGVLLAAAIVEGCKKQGAECLN